LASPRFDPFWKRCQDLETLVFLHPQDSATVTGVAKRVLGAGSLANVIGNPLETTIALSHLIIAVAEFVSIIGIPFAWAHLKLAGIALWPIGKIIVPA
jgi:uncharacterized membrane protein YccF (DUF307 family)